MVVQRKGKETTSRTKEPCALVVALDVGTEYSGWAYSSREDFRCDPAKVCTRTWQGGAIISLKAPTCVLLSEDGRTLEKFGYEAETAYAELLEKNEHEKWLYFRHFKMALWNQNVTREMTIAAENGREVPALTVFALTIRHLAEDALVTHKSRGGTAVQSDVRWVVTVPAIWSDAAKQMMREAAEMAGLPLQNFLLALEPEAASMYARHVTRETSADARSTFDVGKQYIVVDAGGGTVDITVNETAADGSVREIHRPTGGDWGGARVNQTFFKLLEEMTGIPVKESMSKSYMLDYLELYREFEVRKRETRATSDTSVTIRLPQALSKLVLREKGVSLMEVLQSSPCSDQIQLVEDRLRLSHDVVEHLYQPSITQIVKHLSNLTQRPEVCHAKSIVLVGGFANSALLQETISATFPDYRIIIPDKPDLAVLIGAVMFGHNDGWIAERISKLTYGISVHSAFDNKRHPASKRVVREDGEIRCKDVFDKYVILGQTLRVNDVQSMETYNVYESNSSHMDITVYCSSEKNPVFVTDKDCKKVGKLTLPLTGSGRQREITVSMIFGGSEITVEATEEATKNICKLKIDFL
ncbi:heat shock 70 kDa protein 12A-like [Mya arenaria]|uniref:heat shock 70 kDa protein 12A-like n=1 Tax=Mya arenaria TaxID=6604 RepID=UPI0022E6ED2C|nr:heat shock 70 kDa protein 12A-like [Mya arenaria]